jgi:hypothetical protein
LDVLLLNVSIARKPAAVYGNILLDKIINRN